MSYYHDSHSDCFEPPAHTHAPGGPVQPYPINDNPCHPNPCPPKPCHAPDQCCTPVPPPIPPVRYVPGMNVQEQLCNMTERVNTAITRWNYIQRNCYEALDRCVGAAVNNNVYYAPDEVKYMEGYSEDAGCSYQLVEARSCDRSGRPIFCYLRPAYNNEANSGKRELITDVSFVTSAQMVITASEATENRWVGTTIFDGNPAESNADGTVWVAGWNKNGTLKFFRGDVDYQTLRQEGMINCIGPVFPVVKFGCIFDEVVSTLGEEPAAIQAMGWKQNGNKVFFSCGIYNEPGISPVTVARILQRIGCVNAVITSIGRPTAVSNYNPLSDGTNDVPVVSGLTGGMTFLGKLTTAPIDWDIPKNCANWIISKRPPNGWNNSFTTEIADVVQKLGNQDNLLNSVMGQISGSTNDIKAIKIQVDKNTADIGGLNVIVGGFNDRITHVESIVEEVHETVQEYNEKIDELTQGLASEVETRTEQYNELKAKDTNLENLITTEREARTTADANLQAAIDAERSARSTKDTEHESRMDSIVAQEQKDVTELNDKISKLKDGTDLPIATTEKVGVIKVGRNLSIEADGTLSSLGGSGSNFDIIGGTGIDTTKDDTTGNWTVSIDSSIATDDELTNVITSVNDLETEINQNTTDIATISPKVEKNTSDIENITERVDNIVNNPYTLPNASETTLGGIKVGDGLSISDDGTLSAYGKIYTAGDGIVINNENVISNELPTVPVTQEEYDALSDEDKISNKLWMITNPSAGSWPQPSGVEGGIEWSYEKNIIGKFNGKNLCTRLFSGVFPYLSSTGSKIEQISIPWLSEVAEIISITGYVDIPKRFKCFIPSYNPGTTGLSSPFSVSAVSRVIRNELTVWLNIIGDYNDANEINRAPYTLMIMYTEKGE